MIEKEGEQDFDEDDSELALLTEKPVANKATEPTTTRKGTFVGISARALSRMKTSELKAELEIHGLSTKGKKSEFFDRVHQVLPRFGLDDAPRCPARPQERCGQSSQKDEKLGGGAPLPLDRPGSTQIGFRMAHKIAPRHSV